MKKNKIYDYAINLAIVLFLMIPIFGLIGNLINQPISATIINVNNSEILIDTQHFSQEVIDSFKVINEELCAQPVKNNEGCEIVLSLAEYMEVK